MIEYKVDCTLTANLLNDNRVVTYRNTFAKAAVIGDLNTATGLTSNTKVGISRNLVISSGVVATAAVAAAAAGIRYALKRMQKNQA